MEYDLLDKAILLGLAVWFGIKVLDAYADGGLMDCEKEYNKAITKMQEDRRRRELLDLD